MFEKFKKLFKLEENNTKEDNDSKSGKILASGLKHAIKWFIAVSALQIVAAVMVLVMVALLFIPILSAVSSTETWGESFDLTGSALIQSKKGIGGDYAKYFTMSESDIAKLSSNADKNKYRLISLCVQLDEKYNVKLAPVIVGMFYAEAGGRFYENGADYKNILEDLSDRKQKKDTTAATAIRGRGHALGPFQLDGAKGDWSWGDYKPKSLEGLIHEKVLTNQYTPYALNWTYNNMVSRYDTFWSEKPRTSKGHWQRLGPDLKHYMQVYGVEDNEINRQNLNTMMAYFAHHDSTYAYGYVGDKWSVACAESVVAIYAISGQDITNIRLDVKGGNYSSDSTKGPFFGKGYGKNQTTDFVTLDSKYTLTVKGKQLNTSLLEHLRVTYKDTPGSTIETTVATLKETKTHAHKNSAVHFDAMQSSGLVVVGYEVMYDLLEKLGVDADFSGESEDGAEVITGDLPPQYYQSNYSSSYKGAKKEDFFGSVPYGTGRYADVAHKGCGPTCGAMIVSWAKKQRITPKDVIDWCGNTYYVGGAGSDGKALFSNLAKKYGLKYVQIGPYYSKASKKDAEKAYEYLKQGIPLISNQSDKADPNNIFTTGGHFIVLAGLNSDGTIKVYDPNAKNAFTKGYNTRNFTLDEIAKGCRAYFAFVH